MNSKTFLLFLILLLTPIIGKGNTNPIVRVNKTVDSIENVVVHTKHSYTTNEYKTDKFEIQIKYDSTQITPIVDNLVNLKLFIYEKEIEVLRDDCHKLKLYYRYTIIGTIILFILTISLFGIITTIGAKNIHFLKGYLDSFEKRI